MRRRITALLLTLTVMAMSLVPTIVTNTEAANSTELFTNGKFANTTAGIPDGWTFSGGGIANLTGAVDTADKSPDGSDSFKFTQTAPITSMAYFYNNTPITLKNNCDYTVTMWVKSNNIKSMRFYLYEPTYVDRNGVTQTAQTPVEGQNIYTYSYNSGTTRVIRTNLTHTFKLNNAILASGPASMAIVRSPDGSTQLDVSTDFPAQEHKNEWVKLTYTFSTTTEAADIASVRFGVGLKEGQGNTGSASIADLSFTEVEKPFAFTPTVNDSELGGVFPKAITMTTGQSLTFTANPVDGNTFTGWTLNGQNYSTNQTVTAAFNKTDVLKANFAEANIVTNAGAERLAPNANVAPYDTTTSKWTGDWILINYGADKPADAWVTATTSGGAAHYGKQSIKLTARFQIPGRKITGLEKNKAYNVSFWYFLPAYNETGKPTLNFASVIPTNATDKHLPTAGGAALNSVTLNAKGTGTWQCVTIPFNSGNNTEVYLTMKFSSDSGADVMYVDDIGIFSGETVNVSASASQGGTISVSRAGVVPKGSDVVFMATPNAGSNFLGWFDAADLTNKISSDLTYIANANSDINLFAKFDVYQVGITSIGLGGTATVSHTGYVPKNTQVTFTASPYDGNTFKGWYNASNQKVSDNATYIVTVTADTMLSAVFEGYNKPPLEVLKDGSFETTTIPGWFSADPQYGASTWCTWTRSDQHAYEGSYSLKVFSRYRNSILPINKLSKNTTYRISFYAHLDAVGASVQNISNVFIGAPGTTDIGDATVMTSVKGPMKGGPGWQKIQIYFNTGDLSSVNLGIRFVAEPDSAGTGKDSMFIDNLELYEYSATPSFINGNFDDGKAGYSGEFSVNSGKEASLTGESNNIGQLVTVKPYTDYRVKFRAKASATSTLKAAVVDMTSNAITNANLITSYSFVDVTGTAWTDYTLAFNSGAHAAVKLMIDNVGAGTSLVDSITFSEEGGAAQGKIEVIDFETDRFAIKNFSANSVVKALPEYYLQTDYFELYTKQTATDTNVRSGNGSLKIKYNAATNSVERALQQVWSSFQIQPGGSYRLTVWYKTTKPTGGVMISPDATGAYVDEVDHLSESTDWTRLRFNITNGNGYGMVRMVLGNIAHMTASDIYIDDIEFQLAQPMVTEENTRLLYTELLYNAVENQSFELPTTDADWGAKLPSHFKIINTKDSKTGDKAPTQDRYLRVEKSNTKYILSVPTLTGTEYAFGVFVRGAAGTGAYIGISADQAGNSFFVNDDEQPASKIEVTATDGKWRRAGFKFMSSATGFTNIVIESKGGSIDIDNVMLFPVKFGYRYDPNDYTVYVPYNFDDFSANYYINGGEGNQPHVKEDTDTDGDNGGTGNNPENGDTLPVTMMVLVLTAGVSVLAVFATGSKRRKEGANSDE